MKVTRPIKEKIAKTYDMKIASISPTLTKLKEKGMIASIGSPRNGAYILNTHIFGKKDFKKK